MGCSTTKKFFEEPKPQWSFVKDDLLRCYLRGYASKIFFTRKPVVYIDGFAGTGLFEAKTVAPRIDIQSEDIPSCWGSPLIALKTLELSVKQSKVSNPKFYPIFIEKKYYAQLKASINNSQFSELNSEIINGDFQNEISDILKKINGKSKNFNLFCYIDPFGIRDLNMDLFKKLKDSSFNTLELLINFNSFGFFRAACALIKVKIREQEIVLDNDSLDNSIEEYHSAPEQLFNDIMQCSDWYNIIIDYKNGNITGYQAEEEISELYKKQLMKEIPIKYVLDIPIRFNELKHPKYRMIYATMSKDGVMLMADVMRVREEILFRCNSKGEEECLLFEKKDMEDSKPAIDAFMEILEDGNERSFKELFVEFYIRFGLIPFTRCDFLKEVEKTGKIVIRRFPDKTKTGKPKKFYTESSTNKIYIKKA
ncbi:MAG: three-Cys-motif partner protein TcmP [Sphaerochaetaceae bacterium]|nr:three-Cys-motif partner protein TcmP [Sphaerochaetaceae bacterium]